jgi:Flp pilus assembly protein TadD
VEVSLEGEPQDRLFMWQASGNIFRSHPLFGVGAGNMSRMYNLYRPVEVGTGASAVQQLHNTPIQILGELGLLGLISQLFTLGTLAVLWFRLSRKISEVNECYLLYGIGASILGYTVSSLTDYQLENISISSSLVILIVLLIGLSDNYQLSSIGTLSRSKRRWLSLGGITAVVLALFIWIPVNFAMSLVVKSEQDFAAGNFEKAYQKISQASSLVPWDPIYSLLAGFQLLEARETIQDPFLFNQLTKLIAQQFENSQKAAPNDDVFNHNLGIIYQELQDPRQAQLYLSRATQLLSRVPYYTYYLLGQQYLKQGQDKKAATALSVQGLINPEFLTFSAWEKLPLSYIRETVVRETLSELETLWQQTSSNSIYNNIAVLKWWYKKPIQDIDLEKLSPINQALLLVEKTPQKSLEIINTALQENPKNFSLLLFRAWINPEEYLDEYLALNPNLNDGEKKLIQENINNYRNLRDWLVSRKVNLGKFYRQWLIFSYRNYNASKVAYALTPPDIQPYSRVEQLGLFSAYPQVFPPLDQLIAEIRSKQLELPNLQ